MKYLRTSVVFAEIPDEITLAIEITNCPHHCVNCHSPELREDTGIELTTNIIDKLIKRYEDCTCICFMGGDRDHSEILDICKYIRSKYPAYKLAFYSGDRVLNESLYAVLDYYKVGPYVEEFGPLNKPTTNQILYKIEKIKRFLLKPKIKLIDITSKFWKN